MTPQNLRGVGETTAQEIGSPDNPDFATPCGRDSFGLPIAKGNDSSCSSGDARLYDSENRPFQYSGSDTTQQAFAFYSSSGLLREL